MMSEEAPKPELDCFAEFLSRVAGIAAPRVLELGTRGWDNNPPKHNRDAVLAACSGASWLGVDMLDGEGVDVVCDAHQLSGRFPLGLFDAALAVDVLEHCRRPWDVARELGLVVRPGGWLYVRAPQSFPVHHYPGDYFRFTTDALLELFAPDKGWWPVGTRHIWPCKVMPMVNAVLDQGRWNFEAPAWLEAEILAQRG